MNRHTLLATLTTWLFLGLTLHSEDRPQWGESLSRNMISPEKLLIDTFDPKTKMQVKWCVPLGSITNSAPVIAHGKVLVGTNNDVPRDNEQQGDRGVLMCFREADGALLWQFVVPKLDDPGHRRQVDHPRLGITSIPTVEDDRVYLVTNRSEVLCLDLNGKNKESHDPVKDKIATPTREARILWRFDMRQHLGINPHEANNCAPLLHGRFLYVTTGNGVDATHVRGSAPDVPSLIVLDKKTGQLLACDNAHIGPHLIHGQWASPALGRVNGQDLVFFGGGDGVCYAFRALDDAQLQGKAQPVQLELVWSHNGDPRGRRGQILIVSSPVFHHGKVYVAAGGDGHVRQGPSWLHCIDAAKTGDISQSGTVWSYEFRAACVSTPSIHDGRLYLGDFQGTLHCVDLQSGKALWTHAHRGGIWGAALVADEKVYVGTRSGEFVILADSSTKKVVSQVQFEPGRQVMQGFQTNGIHAGPVAANRVLFLATNSQLFALQKEPAR